MARRPWAKPPLALPMGAAQQLPCAKAQNKCHCINWFNWPIKVSDQIREGKGRVAKGILVLIVKRVSCEKGKKGGRKQHDVCVGYIKRPVLGIGAWLVYLYKYDKFGRVIMNIELLILKIIRWLQETGTEIWHEQLLACTYSSHKLSFACKSTHSRWKKWNQ